MAKRLTYASAAILAGFLIAVPTEAVKDPSGKNLANGSGSTMSLYGSSHALRDRSSNDPQSLHDQVGSAMPGWLLMLVGFGVLGAMSRRGSPDPLRDELGL